MVGITTAAVVVGARTAPAQADEPLRPAIPVFAPEVLRWRSEPVVEVLHDGVDGVPGRAIPRLLELRPAIGAVQTQTVRTQRRVAAQHDRRYVVQAYSYADVALRHEVVDASPDGFTVETTCTVPEGGTTTGFDRGVMADADTRLGVLGTRGAVVRATYDHRGLLVAEDAVVSAAGELCRSFREAARPLPLPATPVAEGAVWSVTADARYLGQDVVARYEVHLDRVDGEALAETTSVTIVAAASELEWPADGLEPRTVPELAAPDSAVRSRQGAVRVELGAPMARLRSDELEVRFESSAPLQGGPFYLVDLAGVGVFDG